MKHIEEISKKLAENARQRKGLLRLMGAALQDALGKCLETSGVSPLTMEGCDLDRNTTAQIRFLARYAASDPEGALSVIRQILSGDGERVEFSYDLRCGGRTYQPRSSLVAFRPTPELAGILRSRLENLSVGDGHDMDKIMAF